VKQPVVLIGYNRPDLMQSLISRVRQYQPSRVYVVVDGPAKKRGHRDLVRMTINEIEKIDWPCKVIKIFSSENMGSAKRIISGLDEVFRHETLAIILEDDCLPTQDFFKFCETGVVHMLNNPKIGRIGGQNRWWSEDSEFSAMAVQSSGIWGWATSSAVWQSFRAWQKHGYFDNPAILIRDISGTYGMFRKIVRLRLLANRENRRQWGVQFSIFCRHSGLVGISPRVDLVENVGFDERASRTKKKGINHFDLGPLPEDLKFPDLSLTQANLERKKSRNEFRIYLRSLFWSNR
jgi:hypothetical protein